MPSSTSASVRSAAGVPSAFTSASSFRLSDPLTLCSMFINAVARARSPAVAESLSAMPRKVAFSASEG